MGFVDIILCKFSSNIKGEYLAYFHAQMFCFWGKLNRLISHWVGLALGGGDFAFGGFFITPYVHMPICALGSTNAELGGVTNSVGYMRENAHVQKKENLMHCLFYSGLKFREFSK